MKQTWEKWWESFVAEMGKDFHFDANKPEEEYRIYWEQDYYPSEAAFEEKE